MQRKIVLGIISVGLSSLLFTFIIATTQPRTRSLSQTDSTIQIEKGAKVYDQQCASCHGINGYSALCYDKNNNKTPCAGLPLVNYFLICGEPPKRQLDSNFIGSTEDFISLAITNRHRDISPNQYTFLEPLDPKQTSEITAYLMSYKECVCHEEPLTSFIWPDKVEELIGLD